MCRTETPTIRQPAQKRISILTERSRMPWLSFVGVEVLALHLQGVGATWETDLSATRYFPYAPSGASPPSTRDCHGNGSRLGMAVLGNVACFRLGPDWRCFELITRRGRGTAIPTLSLVGTRIEIGGSGIEDRWKIDVRLPDNNIYCFNCLTPIALVTSRHRVILFRDFAPQTTTRRHLN